MAQIGLEVLYQVGGDGVLGGVLLLLKKSSGTAYHQTPIFKLAEVIVLSDAGDLNQRFHRGGDEDLAAHRAHDAAQVRVHIAAVPIGGDVHLAAADMGSPPAHYQALALWFDAIDLIVVVKGGPRGRGNGLGEARWLHHEIAFHL